MGILDKIIGTYSSRELKRIKPIMQQVLDLEELYSNMSEAELKSQTNILRKRYEDGISLDLSLIHISLRMRKRQSYSTGRLYPLR